MSLTLRAYRPNGTTGGGDDYVSIAYIDEGVTIGKFQAPPRHGRDSGDRQVRTGDSERPVLESGLHIPIGATVPAPGTQRGVGWEYEVEAVGEADDPALLGARFLVVSVPVKSFATARRLDVAQVG